MLKFSIRNKWRLKNLCFIYRKFMAYNKTNGDNLFVTGTTGIVDNLIQTFLDSNLLLLGFIALCGKILVNFMDIFMAAL